MIRKNTISEDFGKEMIEQVDNEIAVKQLTMRENTIDKLNIEAAVAYDKLYRRPTKNVDGLGNRN